jgi:membrane protease YdiL (CAAX protease family)
VFPAPDPQPPPPVADEPSSPGHTRLAAALEVLLCSGFPTQLALGTTIAAMGFMPSASGQLQIGYVVAVSLADSVLLLTLIVLFTLAGGERPREVFLGSRRVSDEIVHGIPLAFTALVAGMAMLLALRYLAPALHDVEQNPLEGLLRSPRDAWLFALVAVIAGGVREELQRAFMIHRFEQRLGGATIGIVVTSTLFGVGHLVQGLDAAVVTGLLGAFWGVVYLRRRSMVAPMVSHAGFDLLQIANYVWLVAKLSPSP